MSKEKIAVVTAKEKKLQVTELHLKMPLKIRQTIKKDGFVITDKSGSEFFFYEEKKGSEKMVYDGCAISVK